jgi:hypothetical protein
MCGMPSMRGTEQWSVFPLANGKSDSIDGKTLRADTRFTRDLLCCQLEIGKS